MAPRTGRSLRGCVRLSEACLLLALVGTPALAAPERVVSMNLCTDQLALMLAAPGQLISVGSYAQDPALSPMAEAAKALPANHGLAEEIYLMAPDLVLTGQFSAGPAVAMLQDLGIPVQVLPPADTIPQIRDQITLMGDLLGRQDAARSLLARFDAGLAAIPHSDKGRAVFYDANGFTAGGQTLTGTVLAQAGWHNIADDLGITHSGTLPLEQLVMSAPDLIVTGARWPGRSRAEAILDHPALRHAARTPTVTTDNAWICGTPFILHAIESLP